MKTDTEVQLMSQAQYEPVHKMIEPEEDEPDYRPGKLYHNPDGSYTWICVKDLHKDNFMLGITMKVLLACFILIAGVLLFTAAGSGFDPMMFWVLLGTFAVITLIALGANWLIAELYGWKYYMVFNMDEEKIVFSQAQNQADINRKIRMLTALTGALTHSPGAMAAGAAAADSNTVESRFSRVGSVKGNREKHLIILRSFLLFNFIYTDEAFYDFIWSYITQQCENASIREV